MSGYMADPLDVATSRVWGGYAANATSVSVTIIGINGTDDGLHDLVYAGDYLILIHAVDRGANLAALGQPNTIGNPWQAVPGASVDYGGGDGPKARVWTKLASATEQAGSTTFTVTSTVASWHELFVIVIPAGLVDPYTTVVAATSSKFGLPATHPSLPIPSGYLNRERNIGLAVGFIAGSTRSAKGWTPADFSGGSYNSTGWYGGGDLRVQNLGDDLLSNDLHSFLEFGLTGLDPSHTLPASGPVPTGWETAPNNYGQCPTVSVSLLLLPWQSYNTPTAGAMSTLFDDFSKPLDSRVTTVGSPTINASGQLVLHGGDQVTYAGVRSIANSQVTLEVPQAAVTATTESVQIQIGSQAWPRYNLIYVETTVDTSGVCQLAVGILDNVSTGGGYYVGPYDPVAHRWWRVRVEDRVLIFDTSPDKVTWFTSMEFGSPAADGDFNFLGDQLDDMQLTLRVAGTASTTGIFDNVGAPFSWQADTVPTARTLAWQGYTPALETTWHGRDVLVGICDQGTTAAVRAAQGITMSNRTYLAGSPLGAPFDNGETFPGEPHGCFVTSCAVPPGGKYVEAVITSYGGSASSSTICSGLLWCAEQGAKVINLSFGGGSDDQTFEDTFAYLAEAYDIEIFIAAGNSNYDYLEVPAAYSEAYDNVHSVGAFDEITSTRAYFSDHSTDLSGVAPGLNVTGRSPTGLPLTGSGTSYASPLSVQICARLLTGGTRAPSTVGRALNAYTHDTGSSRDDQGGGAFNLGLAAASIDIPPKTLLPGIAMPRFVDGQWADVAEGFDQMATAVDLKGTACLVRRASVAANLANNYHAVVDWEQLDVDTYGGMWDPNYPVVVNIPVDGLYQATAVVRFNYYLAEGGTNTGPPYSVGTREITICYNGSDAVADGIGNTRLPTSVDGEGITLAVTAVAPFFEGDFLMLDIWQNSGGTIECAQLDFCGTYFSVARLAPLAPTLSTTTPPVTGLTVSSSTYNSVALAWTNPTSGDQTSTLIRRAAGPTPPAGITDGTLIGAVDAPGSSLVDSTVAPATTYSYSVFARNIAYNYAEPAVVALTTPALPPPPGPTTGLTIGTVTASSLGLTWTNPTTGGVFAGTMLRRNTSSTPPSSPTDGTLVADLGPGVTSYTDSGLTASTTYSYAAFSHTGDPIYATGATATRATTVDLTIHGTAAPTLTSTRTGAYLLGLQIQVSAPATLKAFRFYRPSTAVGGPLQFALWDIPTAFGYPPQPGVANNGLVSGTPVSLTPSGTGWLQVAPPTVPTLTANWPYMVTVYAPSGFPETTPFWASTGPGANGITVTAGTFTLSAPSRANASYTHAQEVYNTTAGGNSVCPTTDGGTNGPCWYIDAVINPIT